MSEQISRNPRTPLTKVLERAWGAVITKHCSYTEGSPDVNSEAALQAYFFAELRNHLKSAMDCNERVFVEPNFRIGTETITPDLVICRNQQVISVIELKYLPRYNYEIGKSLPKGFLKDRESLRKLFVASQSDQALHFKHQRFVSNSENNCETFSLSRRTLFVWAGVYSANENSAENWIEFSNTADHSPILQLHTLVNAAGEMTTNTRFA